MYKIVRGESLEAVEKEITLLLEAGWQLVGSPFSTEGAFTQALTRDNGLVTIPSDTYDSLFTARETLRKLRAAGVNNWEGYSHAMSEDFS